MMLAAAQRRGNGGGARGVLQGFLAVVGCRRWRSFVWFGLVGVVVVYLFLGLWDGFGHESETKSQRLPAFPRPGWDGSKSSDDGGGRNGNGSEDGMEYWIWNTTTAFKCLEDVPTTTSKSKNETKAMDECDLFPIHLLAKIQVVLTVSAADDWTWTDAQLSTVIKCIPNVLIVSDMQHTYGPDHITVDVLADLDPQTYMTAEDFDIYQQHIAAVAADNTDTTTSSPTSNTSNAASTPEYLKQAHKLDKYKFLPSVEKAVQKNMLADWYVFFPSTTYIFWDNLFRQLEGYNASLPYYFGSPVPWKGEEGEETQNRSREEVEGGSEASTPQHPIWFAADTFVLSRTTAHHLVQRTRKPFRRQGPRISQIYADAVRKAVMPGSVLAWALYEKASTVISGLYPLFNPHYIHNIPFGEEAWCEPVISVRGSHPGLFIRIWKWENRRDRRGVDGTLLYRHIFQHAVLPTADFSRTKSVWGNIFGKYFAESGEHASPDACEKACKEHPECYQFIWSEEHCRFSKSISLGTEYKPDVKPGKMELVAGWDAEKIRKLVREQRCEEGAHWVKPSFRTL